MASANYPVEKPATFVRSHFAHKDAKLDKGNLPRGATKTLTTSLLLPVLPVNSSSRRDGRDRCPSGPLGVRQSLPIQQTLGVTTRLGSTNLNPTVIRDPGSGLRAHLTPKASTTSIKNTKTHAAFPRVDNLATRWCKEMMKLTLQKKLPANTSPRSAGLADAVEH
jgi:hypothetical protein